MSYTQRQVERIVQRAVSSERHHLERLGARHQPHRHAPALALANTPGLWEHFTVVPGEFYAREGRVAVITCPCGYVDPEIGEAPQLRLAFGDLLECPGCGRLYFNGTRLHAANPGDTPAIAHSHPLEQPCLPPCPEYA